MTAHSSLTLGQRRRLDKGTMVPAFRHTDRAPREPFPFASHRPLSEIWGTGGVYIEGRLHPESPAAE
jgi:hypothetical protein